jgi:glucosamine-6-phosphate deaminase
MKIEVHPSREAAGQAAAHAAAAAIAEIAAAQEAIAVIFATGASQFATLAALTAIENLPWERVTGFHMDEYVGLPADHPASFRRYMAEALFDHVDLAPERIHVPDGQAADVPASCAAYETAIAAAGGLDLAVLGLGGDGHIAFNEPTSSLGSRTRLKTISEATRAANRHAFGAEPVPHHVITMGIATILSAHRCVLLATGERKAAALAKTVEGPLAALVPSSALQLHPHATVLCDEAAASALALADYYRAVYAAKPAWQRD